jgi:hypothetical protein
VMKLELVARNRQTLSTPVTHLTIFGNLVCRVG